MYTDDGTNDPNGRSTSFLQQESSNPSVYTKLSCFLPWIAEQYNMEYEVSSGTDAECEAGVGDRTVQDQLAVRRLGRGAVPVSILLEWEAA